MKNVQQSSADLYNQYKDIAHKIADVKYAAALLQWDQETYLPSKGATARARQLATLNETAHQWFTDEKFGSLLEELRCKSDLTEIQKKNISLTFEDYQKQKKYTSSFVRILSETISKVFYAWIEARKANSFSVFEKSLSALVDLKIQESDIVGYSEHPYDAHLKEFEKSTSVKDLDKIFNDISTPLQELIEKYSNDVVDEAFLKRYYPKDKQWEWSLFLIKELGFDSEAGRQDLSEHPFTTSFNAKDVRITTRINEHDFSSMTWSCIHEVGHALYEQGLRDEEYGLPSGEYASLSIHESQSRLWENCVGRSYEFWQHYFPALQQYFPEQLADVQLTQFVKAINKVKPSLIRTEADELTYHFHVFIRYTIEKELISKQLSVREIPARWNELYGKYLHVQPTDDKQGCLQDVHWSHGSFGYFPTYSLGSFYAAQFWNTINQQQNVKNQMANGQIQDLLHWLREHIHTKGRLFTSQELCKEVTGEGLNFSYFIRYINAKLST